MAWTSPLTAVANTPFTAAQWNVYVRDNLNTTAPGVATAAGRWITVSGLNSIIERSVGVEYLGTSDTTDSTSYDDLDTFGPEVAITTGEKTIFTIGAMISNSTAGRGGRMSVQVSGSTSIGAGDGSCFYAESGNTNDAYKGTWTAMFETLVPGSNTFTSKYRAASGPTATFSERLLMIAPF